MIWKPKYKPQTKENCECRPCVEAKKYRKTYYKENKGKIIANSQTWRKENRERFNAYYRHRTALKGE